MSNGEVCCILGVCCPPEQREDEAVTVLARDMGIPEEHARAAFCWFDERFDFAPKGLLQPLIDYVAQHAKKQK